MARHCTVCGRELVKTAGPIGPKCLQKLKPKNARVRGSTQKQHKIICAKYDMYGGTNGSRENDETSEGVEGQETCQDGETDETTETTS